MQNPDTGFMSYQHFRYGNLYSDCATDSKNNMTETENYECYPVPKGVVESGRQEGYFPDTSIAYIRFLWKEFEPQNGEYNYKFIENIIKEAKSAKQSLMIRMMPHSTCQRDDVPDWLKSIISCPERPDGMRVKDSPTDPKFLKLFSGAVKALGERFDSDPVLTSIDIALPGAWGEGHNLHLYSEDDLNNLYKTYTMAFKNTRLIGQLRSPEFIMNISHSNKIGIRADGFGEPNHMNNLYPPCMDKISDIWKTSPISFESYWWIGEWYRKGWDIDNFIEKSLSWHISSFNAKSMPVPYEWKDKIEYWISRMGYHYTIKSFSFPHTVEKNSKAEVVLHIDNIGCAPIYNDAILYLRLSGGSTHLINADIDIKKWLPGSTTEKIVFDIPKNISSGEYNIELAIFKSDKSPVYLATDATGSDNYYTVGKIIVL